MVVLYLAVEYLLLNHFTRPGGSDQPVALLLILFGTGILTYLFFADLLRGTWSVVMAGAVLLFAVHFALLRVISFVTGPFSPPGLLLFVVCFNVPPLMLVAAIRSLEPGPVLTFIAALHRALRIWLIILGVLTFDLIAVLIFDTLIWPYFWPYPALFVLASGLAAVTWFPELGKGVWMLRSIGLLLILVGQSYFLASIQTARELQSPLAIAHLVGFAGTFGVMIINYVNQINPRNHVEAPPLPARLPAVAVVIPTYGEPYDVLERTVISVKRLDYPPELLFILISDDGHRPEVQSMAELHGVHYNLGAQKDAKAGNLNSALTYLAQQFPQAELILTQDADEVIRSSFLRSTVGYFSDPRTAFVQTPKDTITPKGDPFGTRDRIFYDILQVGRNGFGAAFACGSGVLWRISAIKAIGGFATWNVVEDLTTSYYLHSAGYRSEYHNQILTLGLAPDDVPGLLKQRGTWAVDTWRLFLFDNPLFKRGLSFMQRLQYLELGLFYLTSIIFLPLIMFTPIVSALSGELLPLQTSALLPWATTSILYYLVLSRGQGAYMLRMLEYWAGHWPTYTRAFLIALRSRKKKPRYIVTRKTRVSGFYGYLLWAQFLYLFLGTVALIYTLFLWQGVDIRYRFANASILLFFMLLISRICRTAFYKVRLPGVEGLYKRIIGRLRLVRRVEE